MMVLEGSCENALLLKLLNPRPRSAHTVAQDPIQDTGY